MLKNNRNILSATLLIYLLVISLYFINNFGDNPNHHGIFNFKHYPHTLALTNTYTVLEQPPTEKLQLEAGEIVNIGFYMATHKSAATDWRSVFNYYNNHANFTAREFSITQELDTLNLSNIDLLIIQWPIDAFTTSEINAMETHLTRGARIFFIGEHGDFTPTENQHITDAIIALGGNIYVGTKTISDTTLHTRQNNHLNNHPLMAGVDQVFTGTFADLFIEDTISQAVVVGTKSDGLDYITVADQALFNGRVTVIADYNWMNGSASTTSRYQDNLDFLDNLAIYSNQFVNIVEDGGSPNQMFLAFKTLEQVILGREPASNLSEIDYADAGITGVDASNLAYVNGELATGNYQTTAEIQAMVDGYAGYQNAVALVSGTDTTVTLTADQLNAIAGVTGADPNYESLYIDALINEPDSSFVDPNNPSGAEIQSVVSAVTAAGDAAVSTILDVANTQEPTVLSEDTFAAAGIEGVDASNLAYMATQIDSGAYTTYDDINNMVANYVNYQAVTDALTPTGDPSTIDATGLNNIDGVSGAIDSTETNALYGDALANAADSGEFLDPDNPTTTEINTVIAAVNNIADVSTGTQPTSALTTTDLDNAGIIGATTASISGIANQLATNTLTSVTDMQNMVTGYVSVVDDMNNNTDGTDVTAAELNNIVGVTGAENTNEAFYSDVLSTTTFVDSSNPTPTEIQTVVTAVNNISDVIDGSADGSTLSDTTFSNAGFTEVTNDLLAVITPQLQTGNVTTQTEIQAMISGVAEIVSDINGDADGTSVTATDLNALDGVSGAEVTQETLYSEALTTASTTGFADPNAPTPAEVQTIVTAINRISDVMDGSALPTSLSDQDFAYVGITGVGATNLAVMSDQINAGNLTDLSSIQTVVDAYASITSVVTGVDDGTSLTATELNQITGITGAVTTNEALYITALENADTSLIADPNSPTPTELQSIITSVNAVELVRDGTNSPSTLSPTDFDTLGINGVDSDNLTFVAEQISLGNIADVTQIQAMVDGYNEIVSDIAGTADGTNVTATQLNALDGVNSAVSTNEALYSEALNTAATSFVDSANPASTEIQTIVQSVNAIADITTGSQPPTTLTTTMLDDIGVTDATMASITGIADQLATGNFTSVSDIQTLVDNYNSIVSEITAQPDGSPITATELNALDGVASAQAANESIYTTTLAASPFVNPSQPTAAEIESVITASNNWVDVMNNVQGAEVTESDFQTLGITDLNSANLDALNQQISTGNFSTPSELQTLVNNYNAVFEDAQGNTDASPATATQLNALDGVDDARSMLEVSYAKSMNFALNNGAFANNDGPTVEEMNHVIVAINAIHDVLDGTQSSEILTQEMFTNIGIEVDASDPTSLFSGFNDLNHHNFESLIDRMQRENLNDLDDFKNTVDSIHALQFVAGGVNSTSTISLSTFTTAGITNVSSAIETNMIDQVATGEIVTITQIQAAVQGVNAVLDDMQGNPDSSVSSAAQLNAIAGVNSALVENEVLYAEAIAGTALTSFVNTQSPTPAEIETVITNANTFAVLVDDPLADMSEQTFSDLGIVGVTTANREVVIEAVRHKNIDDLATLQKAVDSLAVIEEYALGNSNTEPTNDDYFNIGFTNVYDDNSDKINASMKEQYSGNFAIAPTFDVSNIASTITTVNDSRWSGELEITNQIPILMDDLFDVTSLTEHRMPVLDNDIDQDGDLLTLLSVDAQGFDIKIDNNEIVYVPKENDPSTLLVQYFVSDGNGGETQAQLTFNNAWEKPRNLPLMPALDPMTIRATALFTEADVPYPVAQDGLGNPIPVSIDGSALFLKPGKNVVHWEAIDPATQLSSKQSQVFYVEPLISFNKDKTVLEGTKALVTLHLNGASPTYPIRVPFTVSGNNNGIDDHDLADGEFVFESGVEAAIEFNLFDDGMIESDETIVITLDDPGESLNLGAKSDITLKISETLIKPTVSIVFKQGNKKVSSLSKDGGDVTVLPKVYYPDRNAGMLVDWTLNFGNGVENTYSDQTEVIIPSAEIPDNLLSAQLEIQVTKVNPNTGLTDTYPETLVKTVSYANVLEQAPVLSDTLDSDNDGIPDAVEGFEDKDNDGIPEYLDNTPLCQLKNMNVTTSLADGYVLESTPGTCLKLGYLSISAGSHSPAVETEEATVVNDDAVEESYGETKIFNFVVEEALDISEIVIPLTKPIDATSRYRKYNFDTGVWFDFVEDTNNILKSAPGYPGFCPPPGSDEYRTGLNLGDLCIEITIEDGGPNDQDGEVNGFIDDPGYVTYSPQGFMISTAEFKLYLGETITIDVCHFVNIDCNLISVSSVTQGPFTVDETNPTLLYLTNPDEFVGEVDLSLTISNGISSQVMNYRVNVLATLPDPTLIRSGALFGIWMSLLLCISRFVFFTRRN